MRDTPIKVASINAFYQLSESEAIRIEQVQEEAEKLEQIANLVDSTLFSEPKRILIDQVQFENLCRGDVIASHGAEIALKDIGLQAMLDSIDRAFASLSSGHKPLFMGADGYPTTEGNDKPLYACPCARLPVYHFSRNIKCDECGEPVRRVYTDKDGNRIFR